MPQVPYLLVGYPIECENCSDIYELQDLLSRKFKIGERTEKTAIQEPEIIILHRSYDSVELEDYPMYLVWKYNKIKKGENTKRLRETINITEKEIPNEIKKFCDENDLVLGDFGIYMDEADSDRKYEIWKIK